MTTTAIAPAAPVTSSADNSATNKSEWTKEIHTPEQTYNANVPCDLIERDPGNRMPTDEAIDALAITIKAEGLLQPINLRQLDNGRYRIIAGETRWLAFRSLGRPTIPAHIRKGEVDAAGDTAKRLIENLSRSDLTPVEEARGFKQLSEQGRTQKEIGALFGRSQPVIANAIRMLALPEDVLEMVNDGRISAAHGVSLVRFARWPRVCSYIADAAVDSDWSAKELDAMRMPDAYGLKEEGFIEDIKTKGHSWEADPIYTIPAALRDDPNFIHADWCSYYVFPENPADDKWTPEKARQDAARAAKVAKSDKKADGLTAAQVEAKKRKDEIKAVRAENAAALAVCLDKLKRTPAPTALMVAIIIESAIAGGYTAKRIRESAELVGVRLPKGLCDDDSRGQGMREVELMAKMDVAELARVAVAVLIIKQSEVCIKEAHGVPDNVERLMNAKVATADLFPSPDVGSLIAAEKDPQRRVVMEKVEAKKAAKAAKKGGKK